MTTFCKATPISTNGTSRVAETSLTIEDALKLFGPSHSAGDKVSAGWMFNVSTPQGSVIVTLYAWKGSRTLTMGSHRHTRDAAVIALRDVLHSKDFFNFSIC